MSICIPGPKIVIDGISLDAAPNSINNVRSGVDIVANSDAPGAGQFSDDPHTSTNVGGSGGVDSWPVPEQTESERKQADEITRRPTEKPEEFDDVKLPDGIKYSKKISKHLTLGDLSANALFANHLRANVGFSVEGIATNLSALATRLIDPIIDKFGPPGQGGKIINSGFRAASGRSLHNRGRAADLQWPGQGESFHMNVAKFVQDSGLKFDQLLVEKGNSWWVHVGYSLEGNSSLTGINPNARSNSTWRYNVKF